MVVDIVLGITLIPLSLAYLENTDTMRVMSQDLLSGYYLGHFLFEHIQV